MGSEMKVTATIVLSLMICSGPASCEPFQNEVRATARAGHNDQAKEVLIYRGMSDASTAVAVGDGMFIVADDENNVLRVYKIRGSGLPVFHCDLTRFLNIEPEHPEADIEGATMVGDTIYWISSHGRNKDGKMRPNRYRFFATSVKVENGKVAIRPVGIPCKSLIHSLVKTGPGRRLGLGRATRFDAPNLTKRERKSLAPKQYGLNIEGLCASGDGQTLYIGFRNPRYYDGVSSRVKALVVALNNPKQVIERGEPAIFGEPRPSDGLGEPILWDLGGLGIRSMEYSHFHKAFFIIAGPRNAEPRFVLYRWSGEKESPPALVRRLSPDESGFSPEALVTFKNSGKFLLLSDDGTLAIKVSSPGECEEGELNYDGTCPNKFLVDQNKKYFRAIWLEL